jgi:small redox-active disulfide protein 2
MKIEIFGTGCAKCAQLEENVRAAVQEACVCAEIVKITQIRDIAARGVVFTPALAVDGVVKSAGKVLSPEEIKRLLPPA